LPGLCKRSCLKHYIHAAPEPVGQKDDYTSPERDEWRRLSRALVSHNGSLSPNDKATPEKLEAAEARISEAAKFVTEAGTLLNEAVATQNEAKQGEAKDSAQRVVRQRHEDLRVKVNDLSDRVLENWSLEARGSELLAASTASSILGVSAQPFSALDLKAIHKTYLDDDDLGTLLDACLTSMEDNPLSPESPEQLTQLTQLRTQLDEAEKKRNQAEKELEKAEQERHSLKGKKRPSKEEEKKEVEEANRKAEQAYQKLEDARTYFKNLRRYYAEKTDSAARTSLLNYCRREGINTITDIITDKVKHRYLMEGFRLYAELCSALASSESVDPATKSSCVQPFFGMLRQVGQYDRHRSFENEEEDY
jgi:hypothetical protein